MKKLDKTRLESREHYVLEQLRSNIDFNFLKECTEKGETSICFEAFLYLTNFLQNELGKIIGRPIIGIVDLYSGSSTRTSKRFEEHEMNKNNIFFYSKVEPEVVLRRPLGLCTEWEAELIERAYINERKEEFKKRLLEHGIVTWPYGTYYVDEVGTRRCQLHDPWPDCIDKLLPQYLRELLEEMEVKKASEGAIVEM